MTRLRGSLAPTGAGDWKHLDVTLSDGVATVAFKRPEKLGALTFEAYADLRDLFTELPRHDEARVVVLAGSGRGFCSGGDVVEIIGELQQMSAAELLDFTRMTGATVKAIRECTLPVIAAVNGIAAGAGSVLALASDLRLLARSASFAFLFTKVGLAGADMGSAYLLPRIVGLGRATELLLLGDRIDSEAAARIGLATAVVEDAELGERAAALARRLADGPAFAYATTKSLIAKEQDMDLAGSLELEAVAQALLMKSDDHREFYAAWRAGRDPEWRGS